MPGAGTSAPPVRDVVLLGGGHAHVQVLKRFGMRPAPGIRLTIVAREPHSPYSGMLPGLVAGWYAWEDIHIDLARLAVFAGARFIAAEASGLDVAERRILFTNRPPLRYDVLSINTGGVPGARFASDFVTPVKPIGGFLPAWRRLVDGGAVKRLAIVGAGPGGVELALAITHRHPIHCLLLEADAQVLPGFAPGARAHLLAVLAERGCEVLTDFRVRAAEGARVTATDGRAVAADHVLWVTGVEAPAWPRAAGLATDAKGFIQVDAMLQSTSHPEVFAAGDVAAQVDAPRVKSGVFAVRQGPTLAANLRRFATSLPLRRFNPQKHALAIVGVGDARAVASRGRLHVTGPWVWRCKQWLDRRFMSRFRELPPMAEPSPTLPPAFADETPQMMRCGGCGAKLGADVLRRVLRRLDVPSSAAVERGIGDDAAVVRLAAGRLAVSCDGFRAMIDDGYRFGRISAHHALNDLFAMGAEPAFALALATVPLMAEAMMEDDLFQMMSGALAVFREHGVDLVGGHSAEGAELSLAFSVSGLLTGSALAKGGLSPGEQLVLTKPVGSGVLLAGAMQGRASANQLLAAIDVMDTSNATAATILRRHGASGCTDVTGFGLAGHLAEMARASGVGVRVDARRVPKLDGVDELMAAGVASSLQNNNEQALDDFIVRGAPPNAPSVRVLADPQTAGGLLAGVPEGRLDACLAALRNHGFDRAQVVGEVTQREWEVVA